MSAQNPAAGVAEVPGDGREPDVSSGPCQAVVPRVVGQKVTAAKSTLAGKRFSQVSAVDNVDLQADNKRQCDQPEADRRLVALDRHDR